jgi:ABC-type multidrug transport system fused ATPase/permease subunit
MAEPYIPSIKDFDFFFKFLFAYFFLQVWGLLIGQGANLRETFKGNDKKNKKDEKVLANQRKYLFQFIFLSTSMIIFAYVMIGFLDVPAREVGNVGVFVFLSASLLKYLFDFTVTDSQVRMIIFSGVALYVDSLRETVGRIAAQF